jgi:hypothetical protein
VALLLGALFGIVAGFLIGFIHNDVHLETLQQWVLGGAGFRWAILGALFGAGLIYTAPVAHIARAMLAILHLDPVRCSLVGHLLEGGGSIRMYSRLNSE